MTDKTLIVRGTTALDRAQQALAPATRDEVAGRVALLVRCFKAADNLDDPQTFVDAMIEELSSYPKDVLDEAIRVARRTLKWSPSIAEMVEICDKLMKPRRYEAKAQRIVANGIRNQSDYFFIVKYAAQQPAVRNWDESESHSKVAAACR
jgi:hypothetical protein